MEDRAQPSKPPLGEGVAETGEAQMSLVAGIECLASLRQRLLRQSAADFFKKPYLPGKLAPVPSIPLLKARRRT